MSKKPLSDYKSIRYNVIIEAKKDDEDIFYVAYCKELSVDACRGIGDTEEEALISFKEEKEYYIDYLYNNNLHIPEAEIPKESYSGTFSVRTSPQLHAILVRQAEEQSVSLNLLVNQYLAFGCGSQQVTQAVNEKLDQIDNNMNYRFGSILSGIKSIAYKTSDIVPLNRFEKSCPSSSPSMKYAVGF